MATIKTTFTCVGTNVSSINSISISPTAKSITVNDPESVGVNDIAHSATFDILPIATNASGTWVYVENAMTSGTDKVSIMQWISTAEATGSGTWIKTQALQPGEFAWFNVASAAETGTDARGCRIDNAAGKTMTVKYARFSR